MTAEGPDQDAVPVVSTVAMPAPSGLTYPEGPDGVIARWNARRHAVEYRKGDALPPLDVDLSALAGQVIAKDPPIPMRRLPPFQRKLLKLRLELVGQTELALLNAILIVNLRRRSYPEHAPALFLRIWREQGAALMQRLPGRWLISSVITFGDVGETEAQRRIGLAMNVVMSMMKLYEAERVYSGFRADVPFNRRPARRSRLPLGMPKFSFLSGGLDYNLLAPIWQEALTEPVAGPLACHLLERLNADPNNIFRRIRKMSAKLQTEAAAPPAATPEGAALDHECADHPSPDGPDGPDLQAAGRDVPQ